MRICILNKNTHCCINVITVDTVTDWSDHGDFIRSPRDDGEIGWTLLADNSWSDPTPVMSTQELTVRVRQRRDKYLHVLVDSINAVRWSTMTLEQQQAWAAYRQALLDVPAQTGFPESVTWPVKPID